MFAQTTRTFVIAGMVSLALAAPAAGGGWLQTETVPGTSDPRSPTTTADVRVVLLDDGAALALTATAGGVVDIARRDAGTGAWTVIRDLARLPRGERARPEVARSGPGVLIAAWAIDGRVQASVRDRSGRWSQPVGLVDAADDGVALAASPAGAVAAWTRDGIVEARVAESGRWGPASALSTADGLARVSRDAAVIDADGRASVAFAQDRSTQEPGTPQAVVATRPPGAGAWTAAPIDPDDAGEAGAPVLGVDAGGTVVAAWSSGELVATAVRTAAATSWRIDPHRRGRAGESVQTPILAVDASGRAILGAFAGSAGARRVTVRDGAADPWRELRAAGAGGGAAPVAGVVTRAGDAFLVFASERPGGCQMEVVAMSSRGDAPALDGSPRIGCEPLSVATDGDGTALLAGTSQQGVRVTLRPAKGLRLTARRVEAASTDARVALEMVLSAPAQVLVTVRAPNGRVVRRAQATRPGGVSRLTVGIRGLPAGRYQLAVQARSGTTESPLRVTPLRLA